MSSHRPAVPGLRPQRPSGVNLLNVHAMRWLNGYLT
jgi:hypothetical protein